MKIDVEPDWWKTMFDDVYLQTDARSVCNEEITRREVDFICNTLPIRPTDAILDLCGGQGRHSLELARRGFTGCTVLDYSQVLIERGRDTAAKMVRCVKFVQGDATDTGLPELTFDYVLILGNSLGYLPETADDLRILQEAFRVLRPGGRLLVDVTDGAVVREQFNPNAWHEIEEKIVVCRQRELSDKLIRAREIVLCKERGLVRDRCYAIRLYSPETLEALTSEAGFVDVSVEGGYSVHDKTGDYGFMNHRLIITANKLTTA
jgi:D-alanine-D-alanine ligase